MTDKAYWKSIERCIYCHEKDAYTMSGRSLCAECAEKERVKRREKYASDPEKHRQKNVDYYNLRKEKHLCVKCGQPLEEGNPRVRCMRCTRKLARTAHSAVERNRPPEQNFPRGDNGICYVCNRNPITPGRKCCEECYPKLREQMLNAKALQNMDEHPWKARLLCAGV